MSVISPSVIRVAKVGVGTGSRKAARGWSCALLLTMLPVFDLGRSMNKALTHHIQILRREHLRRLLDNCQTLESGLSEPRSRGTCTTRTTKDQALADRQYRIGRKVSGVKEGGFCSALRGSCYCYSSSYVEFSDFILYNTHAFLLPTTTSFRDRERHTHTR